MPCHPGQPSQAIIITGDKVNQIGNPGGNQGNNAAARVQGSVWRLVRVPCHPSLLGRNGSLLWILPHGLVRIASHDLALCLGLGGGEPRHYRTGDRSVVQESIRTCLCGHTNNSRRTKPSKTARNPHSVCVLMTKKMKQVYGYIVAGLMPPPLSLSLSYTSRILNVL